MSDFFGSDKAIFKVFLAIIAKNSFKMFVH